MADPNDPATGAAADASTDPHEPKVLAPNRLKWALLMYLVAWLGAVGAVSASPLRSAIGGPPAAPPAAPASPKDGESRAPAPSAVASGSSSLIAIPVATGGTDASPRGAAPGERTPAAAAPPQPAKADSRPPSGAAGPLLSVARLWLLIVAMGALGGTLHGIASLSTHTGRGTLYVGWWTFYIARPFVGAGLAAVVGLILTGGVAGFGVDADRRGQYTLLAWAALAGLFAEPALQKLRDVFEALFRGGSGAKPAKG